MKRTSVPKQAILLAAFFFALLSSSMFMTPVQGVTTGLVCMANAGTTTCPPSPPNFMGSPGSTLSIAINIQNSAAFNGFDIQVKADPTILNGTSVDATGNVFQSMGGMLFIAGECINGHLISGGSCSPQDGPGVVHFAASSNVSPTGGHLYNINYKILSSTSTSITFQTGCTGTSNGTACVTIVEASTIEPENLQTATFNAAPSPDFTITLTPSSQSVPRGSSTTFTITVTGTNGFNMNVNLAASVSPVVRHGPTTSLPAVVGPNSSSTLTVFTAHNTPTGTYTVTVIATSGSLSHSASVSVIVTR